MSAGPSADLVHAPLAGWAQTRGDAVAIRCGNSTLSFAQLHRQLTQRATALANAQAPASVLVDPQQAITQRLVDFLGIVASGRCAVVGDPDWPLAVRQSVQASLPTRAQALPPPQPESPFYVGYTSGSSGAPKGYRRHHRSWTTSFRACIQAFGADARGCVLAPGRDAHSLFLFGMLLGLWSGGGVVVQEQFSASAALRTLRAGHCTCLVAVPSQLLLMLECARHPGQAPVRGVRLVLISGARWSRQHTPELRALFPDARIIEFYGASETSFVAWMESDEHASADTVGQPFAEVDVQIRPPFSKDGAGLIYVRSPMLFMDYVGGSHADASAALRDGDWLCVRDLGALDAQGRLRVAGRHNRMLVTLGKNLFPEELESVLERHPAIASASVHGLVDRMRGLQVVAIIRWAWDTTSDHTDHTDLPNALALKAWCKQQLEAYKTPRRFYVCTDWRLTASGKTDHPALEGLLQAHAAASAANPLAPCLTPLP